MTRLQPGDSLTVVTSRSVLRCTLVDETPQWVEVKLDRGDTCLVSYSSIVSITIRGKADADEWLTPADVEA